jgi:bacteriocin-like protein
VNDDLKKEGQDSSELSNAELENVTGGEISLPYGKIEIVYTPQKPDGPITENKSGK